MINLSLSHDCEGRSYRTRVLTIEHTELLEQRQGRMRDRCGQLSCVSITVMFSFSLSCSIFPGKPYLRTHLVVLPPSAVAATNAESVPAHTVFRPVLILSPCSLSHVGNERPKNNEKPNMHMFLDELRSTYCRFDTPTAAIMPVAITTLEVLSCTIKL